jgi:hypothetical protein
MEAYQQPPMTRVLAAKFPDRAHASQALESLQRRLDEPVEAEIAPLAAGNEPAAQDTLLAGHFAEDHKPQVEEIVRQAGGEIVADVDERWTKPRTHILDDAPEGGGFAY